MSALTDQPIEYAVKMRQCPAEARLDRVIARGELTAQHIDRMAAAVSAFHDSAAVAGPDSPFGGEAAYRPVADTFEQLLRSTGEPVLRERVAALQNWAVAEFAKNRRTYVSLASSRAGCVKVMATCTWRT